MDARWEPTGTYLRRALWLTYLPAKLTDAIMDELKRGEVDQVQGLQLARMRVESLQGRIHGVP